MEEFKPYPITDESCCSPKTCPDINDGSSIPVCCKPTVEEMLEREELRNAELMETCDKFYHRFNLLKELYGVECNEHNITKTMLKETEAREHSYLKKLYQIRDLLNENESSIRMSKELKSEVSKILRF